MMTCVQEKVYYYFVTGALDLVPNLEEQMDDGMTSCVRWHRRTLKIVGNDGKYTAQNRVQMAVAHLERNGNYLAPFPRYYLTIILTQGGLESLDQRIQATPHEPNCPYLAGKVQGRKGMSDLINLLLSTGHTAHCLPK
jgi:hypothetical protein